MNNRILSVMTVMTLVAISSGCCGMKNFMFGRGAKCGLCNLGSCLPKPSFGNSMAAPCGTPAPSYAPSYAPAPTCQSQPAPIAAAPHADCGCQNYAGNVYDGGVYSSGCGCGHEGYGPVSSDPYISADPIVGVPGSQVYDSGSVYDGGFIPNAPYSGGSVPADNFQSRRFDTDGNKILWEEPLPSGAQPL